MALPIQVTWNLNTTIATNAIVLNSSATTSGPLPLSGTYGTAAPLGTGVLGTAQQRITVSSAGNDSGIYFHIIGLNQAGFTVSEFLVGGNNATVQSNLDFRTIISIQPSSSSTSQQIATTAATVGVGLNGVGSTPWYIMNWHVSPTNIECSGVLVGSANATWGVQYTYDDPNNLLPGVAFPQAFNHPTLVNQTASLDGPINDPVTAVRFIISAGTGTIRGTIIQAGIGSP